MNKLAAILPIVFVILVSGCSQEAAPAKGAENTIAEVGGTGANPTEGGAPSEPEPAGPSVKEVKLKITHDGGYDPSTVTVSAGDIVRFLVTSDPVSHRHGISIDELGLNTEVIKKSTETPQIVEFTADKSGEFTIYCKTCLDGWGPHPWMVGKLTVE